jgi:hypothetical protein
LLSFGAESFVFQFAIYSTKCLPVVLCGRENRLLSLREERSLRVFENRMRRRMFGPMRDERMGGEENYVMRRLIICTSHNIILV